MRKMIITTLLILLFSIQLLAPGFTQLYILKPDEINYYDNLIKAVVQVESSGNQYAYNEAEGAVSYFQIRNCRLQEYNAKTGLKMRLTDMYDYAKARNVFLYFTNGRDYETVARCWAGGERGTKKATEKYWQKIKQVL